MSLLSWVTLCWIELNSLVGSKGHWKGVSYPLKPFLSSFWKERRKRVMETSKSVSFKSLRVKDNHDFTALESKTYRSRREGEGAPGRRQRWKKSPFLTGFWICRIIPCLWLSSVYRVLSIAALFIPFSIYTIIFFFLKQVLLWSPQNLWYVGRNIPGSQNTCYCKWFSQISSPIYFFITSVLFLWTADGNVKCSQLFFP